MDAADHVARVFCCVAIYLTCAFANPKYGTHGLGAIEQRECADVGHGTSEVADEQKPARLALSSKNLPNCATCMSDAYDQEMRHSPEASQTRYE